MSKGKKHKPKNSNIKRPAPAWKDNPRSSEEPAIKTAEEVIETAALEPAALAEMPVGSVKEASETAEKAVEVITAAPPEPEPMPVEEQAEVSPEESPEFLPVQEITAEEPVPEPVSEEPATETAAETPLPGQVSEEPITEPPAEEPSTEPAAADPPTGSATEESLPETASEVTAPAPTAEEAVAEDAAPDDPAEPEKPRRLTYKEAKRERRRRKKKPWQIILLLFWDLIKFIVLGAILCGLVATAVVTHKVLSYKDVAEEKYAAITDANFLKTNNTVIYDADGAIISEMNEIIYEYLPISKVSDYVYEGYIATEDQRFLEHRGVDYLSIFRAAIEYVRNRGAITQGGSTITQQLIKNNVLSNEQTLDRKITEMFLAYMFEQEHSKDEIMEFYLNTNFYGNNCYGIEAASQYYFGKETKDLGLAEAAMLIGISKGGSFYNPRSHYGEAKGRQEYVLDRMYEEGYITEKQRDYSKKLKLDFVFERPVVPSEKYMTSFAIYSAAIDLMEQEGFEFEYVFDTREEMYAYQAGYQNRLNELMADIRKGGYHIYTSLRPDIQEHVQEILNDVTSKYTEVTDAGKLAFQGAAVIVNNKTGYVEAIIGGRELDDDFNRGYLAKRQPGSSIKPVAVYTPAYDSGFYYPSFTLIDKDNPDDPYWPENVTGKNTGQMSLRDAIVQSTNTIAYQIMKAMQPRYAIGYLEKLKFSSLAPEDNYSYAIALGGFTYGVSPFEMAKAYSTIANLGEYIDNNCVQRIEKQGEGVIFTEDSSRHRVYSEDAAYLTIDCCKGYLRQNYMTRRAPKNAILFAKTGTTNLAKDVWFCGGSTYYSCAVWLGYDMPRETNLKSSGLPADIWCRIMTDLHEGLEKEEFERPETVIYKSIDWKGDPAGFRSGRTDLFSDVLLQKARESDVFLGIVLTDEDRKWGKEEEEEVELDENGNPIVPNPDGLPDGVESGGNGGQSSTPPLPSDPDTVDTPTEPVYVPEIPPWIIPENPPAPTPAPAPAEPSPAPVEPAPVPTEPVSEDPSAAAADPATV